MGNPDRKPGVEPRTRIRYMPTLCYIEETVKEESVVITKKWIGMKADVAPGTTMEVLFWRNFYGNLNDEAGRHSAAVLIARIKLARVYAAIGMPVDLLQSLDTGSIKTIDGQTQYGVYIEDTYRPGFTLYKWTGLATEEHLRKTNQREFDEAFRNAKAFLPYPKPSPAPQAI